MEALLMAANRTTGMPPMPHGGQDVAFVLGSLGCAFAVGLSAIGGAIGTAKAGMGLQSLKNTNVYFTAMIPIVMAGIVSIYGLILSVVLMPKIKKAHHYSVYDGAMHMSAGLAVGIPCLAAGYAIGAISQKWYEEMNKDSGNAGIGKMVLLLVFSEALGLYGLIVGLLLANSE